LLKEWKILIILDFRAKGFPEELIDNEPEEKGYEI
jgi:3-hydroxyisobutyrate dehydrogenase